MSRFDFREGDVMFDVNFQTAQLYLSRLHVAVMFCMSRATNRNVNVLENFQIRLHLVIFKNHLLGWKYTRVNLLFRRAS